MNKYKDKRKRSKKERIGFYTALSICMVAVGMAAYSTYSNLSSVSDELTTPVAVNNVVTGVTETEPETEPPTETETEPPTEPETEPPTEPETEFVETAPEETKTALETMLSVEESLSFPLDTAKVLREYSEETVYNKTLNQWNAHTGVDFACKKGDKVYSMGNGEVVKVYRDDLLGQTAVIKAATYTAYYSGLEKDSMPSKGSEVKAGEVIGTADAVPCEKLDESHIHVAVKVNGQYVDPMTLINNED